MFGHGVLTLMCGYARSCVYNCCVWTLSLREGSSSGVHVLDIRQGLSLSLSLARARALSLPLSHSFTFRPPALTGHDPLAFARFHVYFLGVVGAT